MWAWRTLSGVADYCAAVQSDCRSQAADDFWRYLPRVRKHLLWLRSQAAGESLEPVDY